jgi:hypothetical protein
MWAIATFNDSLGERSTPEAVLAYQYCLAQLFRKKFKGARNHKGSLLNPIGLPSNVVKDCAAETDKLPEFENTNVHEIGVLFRARKSHVQDTRQHDIGKDHDEAENDRADAA